ncbi:MAG: helix-turn-helix domain-containing protein [Pseudolabrys sp.]
MDNGRFPQSAFTGLPSPDAHGVLPGDLVRAVQWISTHLNEPLRIAQLAAVAGVPARTLETHFQQYLGTTPLGWLRHTRLAYARQQFITSNGKASVTEVATASGFSQLGRFSGHYRDAFGELPSQTRRRAIRSMQDSDEIDDDAVFLTWRAVAAAYQVAPKGCSEALEDLARAQELAPHYGLPKALEAWCIGQSTVHNFNAPAGSREKSIRLAQEAQELAPNDALTLSLCSSALTLARRLDEADALIERAAAIDPWSAMVWVRRGWISAYCGDSEAAIRELGFTLRLMPFEPIKHLIMIGIGCAHFGAGRYDRAARWAREGVSAHPGSFWADRIVVAAAAQYGARDEARRTAKSLMRKDPDLTVSMARDAWPFTPEFAGRLAEGLESAGVPRS